MVLAIVLVLLVVGSVLFHVLRPWYFTPIASNWVTIDDTVHITFWVTGIVFVVVNLFMAWCVLRYRATEDEARRSTSPRTRSSRAGSSSSPRWVSPRCSRPDSSSGPSSSTCRRMRRWSKSSASSGRGRIAFPGADGVLGTDDARFVSEKNPFGINPNDPHGQDDVLIASPEFHLPMGKPYKALLRSIDVLHNFTVPQFRVKMDLVPGLVTYVWFTPTRAGQLRRAVRGALRHRPLHDARQGRGRGGGRVQDVARDLSDVRPVAGAGPGRRGSGTTGIRGLRRMPRRARGGQSRAQRAEARGAGRLVPEAAAPELQERRARRAREGHLRQDDGADGGDAHRRRGDRQRRRLHQDAPGPAGPADGDARMGAAAKRRSTPAAAVTAPPARACRRRMRRAFRA